ncbi:MAG: isomerizing glutamine--fructose-6-phosphate transaminase, partial [Sedimentisphaerales bacterium]|nr:isomerizing glutamine--fructose-6-phosphate transaminase [Sedimentisphaerales bacterium]
MCGIVAYLGQKPARSILIEGLKRLEYRGYDSAGIALLEGNTVSIKKTAGRISALEDILPRQETGEVLGIGHTRWATHGQPNTINAHPHMDYSGKIVVVHNGIIENYATLKTWLKTEGCTFSSDTDSEVIAALIGYFYEHGSTPNGEGPTDGANRFEWAVLQTLREVVGTYGLAILCTDFPDMLIGAKKGSPLILGVGENEFIIASDAAAIVEHTTQAIYLSDGEIVTITPNGFRTKTLANVPVTKELKEIEFSLEQIELAGCDHYMQKEINEQPESVRTCLQGRVDLLNARVVLGGLQSHLRELTRTRRIILSACGTAWHAGLVGEFLFEQLARIPAEVEYA